jgi:TetR/AcrR family transcriptional regulator, fatty acid metabolism regulator protein
MKVIDNSNIDRLKILKFITVKFHMEGFYKTSMDEIAQELRMSKKTIYKFFPSKENLLEVICRNTMDELEYDINKIVKGKGDVIDKIINIFNMYCNYISNISEKWINDLRIHYPMITKDIENFRKGKIYEILVKLIEKGKKEKLIENYPGPIVINNFTVTIQSLLHTDFIINNKFSMQEAFKYTFDMLFNGILTKKGKERYRNRKKLNKPK